MTPRITLDLSEYERLKSNSDIRADLIEKYIMAIKKVFNISPEELFKRLDQFEHRDSQMILQKLAQEGKL